MSGQPSPSDTGRKTEEPVFGQKGMVFWKNHWVSGLLQGILRDSDLKIPDTIIRARIRRRSESTDPLPATPPPLMTNRKFGYVFAIALIVLAGILWVLFDVLFRGLIAAAAIFALLSLLAPGLLLPVNRLWMVFAGRLGAVNNHLLLGIVYILMIVPVALFMRLIGRDLMQRRIDREAGSYFIPVSRQTDAETMHDIF